MVKSNFEAPHCTVSAFKYCQGPCYHSGRDQEGHWNNLGQRECWLLTITSVQEVLVAVEQQVIVSAAYIHACMHGEFRKWSLEYSKAGTTVTLAP
jgi:hypothetical protein